MKGEEKQRPLSPHLSIYKPQITSVLSISHRASGFFLYIGLLIFSWYFIATTLDVAAVFTKYTALFFASIIGKAALFFWVLAFYYHFCNGIRHLIWDAGYGYSIKSVKLTGVITIIAALSLTAVSWFYAISKLIS